MGSARSPRIAMAARAIAAVRLSVGALTAATRSIAREPLARVVVHSSGALLPATRAGWGGRRQGVAGTPRGNVAMAAARSLMANGDMTRCHVRSFSSDAEGPKDMGPDLGPAPPAAGFRGALPSIPRTRGYQGGSRLGVQGSNYSDTGFRNVGRDAYRQQRNPRFANNAGGFWDNGKFIKDPRKPDHFPRGLKVIVKEGMSIDFAYKKLHRQVMGEAYPKKVKKAMTWITPTIRRRREKEYWLYQRYKAKMRWQRKQVEMKIATAKLRFD